MNKTTSTFDDTLAQTGNRSSALTRGMQMARQRAEEDAPDEFCRACVDATPLAFENASDAHTVRFIEDASDAVAERIVELGEDLTDRFWVRQEMQDEYVNTYYDACADPEDCEVCQHPEAYDECGHERHLGPGECPVRGEA